MSKTWAEEGSAAAAQPACPGELCRDAPTQPSQPSEGAVGPFWGELLMVDHQPWLE